MTEQQIILPTTFPFYSQRVEAGSAVACGFESEEAGQYWTSRGCGIACVRMVIDGLRASLGQDSCPGQGTMIRRGLELGAYTERGWTHKGLVQLAEEYGLKGRCFRRSTLDHVVEELRMQRPSIVSVTVCFEGGLRDDAGEIQEPGGHLAVVLGHTEREGQVTGLVVNHPSASAENNWQMRLVETERFRPSFAGAFMSFST